MVKNPTSKSDPELLIIESALQLAITHGWRHVNMREIAKTAGLPFSDLLRLMPTKDALPGLLISRIDGLLLDQIGTSDSDEPERDRLFDILMTRFDLLTPYREGIAAVMLGNLCAPLAMLSQLFTLHNSMAMMLEAADISSSGPFGRLRIKGLMGVYMSVFRTWLKDDTQDSSKTMAALDRALDNAEKIAHRIPNC